MPQTRECDYCGADIEPGTGTMYVRVNGSVSHFCSSKCEKNAGLGREPREVEWTAEGSRGPRDRTGDVTAEPAADDGASEAESQDGSEVEASPESTESDLE